MLYFNRPAQILFPSLLSRPRPEKKTPGQKLIFCPPCTDSGRNRFAIEQDRSAPWLRRQGSAFPNVDRTGEMLRDMLGRRPQHQWPPRHINDVPIPSGWKPPERQHSLVFVLLVVAAHGAFGGSEVLAPVLRDVVNTSVNGFCRVMMQKLDDPPHEYAHENQE